MSTKLSDIAVQIDRPLRLFRGPVKGSTLALVRTCNLDPKPAGWQSFNSSDEILRTIVEACASNVVMLDEAGVVLYASRASERFGKAHGLPTALNKIATPFEYFIRLTNGACRSEVDTTLADEIWRLRTGNAREFQAEFCYRGVKQPIHLNIHGARVDLSSGGFRILLSYTDIMSPADALRASEQRFSQLLENTRIVVWEAEAENWRFIYIGEQAVKVFGYPLAQWYEPNFLALHIHPDDRDRVLSFSRKESQVEGQYDFTFRLLAKNGRIVWVHNLVSVTRRKNGTMSLRGFMIDISERKCAEEALRDLGGRLIAAQEEERSRIARELHDDLNQRMALLSIELEQIRQNLGKPVSIRRRLKALQTQAQDIAGDIHRLSYKLHPSKLDHLGLGAAVNSLCEELSKSGKLKVDVQLKGFPADLPRDLTLCIFRVAQEALRNCVKHSSAQAVHVVLERNTTAIHLSVSDNGCGFNTNSPLTREGLGFVSMRERVRLVGGEMKIYSQPQRGTLIEVSVPLDRSNATCVIN